MALSITTSGVFQSTPAIAGERCDLPGTECATTAGFNPRPPSLASGARRRPCLRLGREVSIHARHRWRAVLSSARRFASPRTFQSTPAIAGERCASAPYSPAPARCFNPRPPSLASGACAVTRSRGSVSGFNPRPPSLASGARRHRLGADGERVSIHARHRWRAVRRQRGAGGLGLAVSIHARHRWRAVLYVREEAREYERVSIHARHRWRAVHGCGRSARVVDVVSIHARHRWRAVRGTRCLRAPGRSFNPRPPSLASGALQRFTKRLMTTSFQSTPAIAGERCVASVSPLRM